MNSKDSIINFLTELEAELKYNVYIPSLDKEVLFKQLTTEQLKLILQTAINSTIYNTDFILTINNIIKQNCLDVDVDTNTLTIFDKLFFIFKTKIECISPEYNFIFTDDEINEYSLENGTYSANIVDHFNTFKNTKPPLEKEFTNGNFKIKCALPTLNIESKLEEELHTNITSTDTLTEQEMQNIVGETFVSELAKFINSITINDTLHDLNTLSFKDRTSIIEKIPVSIINDIIKYIENYKNIIDGLLSYTFVTDKGVAFERSFPIDATFFNI